MDKVVHNHLLAIQEQIRANGYNERDLRFKHFGIKHYDLRSLYFVTPQYRHPLNVFGDKIKFDFNFDSPKGEEMNRIGSPDIYMGYFMKTDAGEEDLPTFMIYMRYFDCSKEGNSSEYIYVPLLEVTKTVETAARGVQRKREYLTIEPSPVFEDPELSDLVFYLGAMSSRCANMIQLHRDLKVCRFNITYNGQEVAALGDNPAAYVMDVIRQGPGKHLIAG